MSIDGRENGYPTYNLLSRNPILVSHTANDSTFEILSPATSDLLRIYIKQPTSRAIGVLAYVGVYESRHDDDGALRLMRFVDSTQKDYVLECAHESFTIYCENSPFICNINRRSDLVRHTLSSYILHTTSKISISIY